MTGRRLEAPGAALAAAWLLGVVLADMLVTRADVAFVVFFAVSPLIACAVLPPRWTAAFSLAAIGLAIASGSWNGDLGEVQHALRVVDVTVISVAAVVVAQVRVRREQRFSRVLAIAEAAQRAILPTVPQSVDGLRIAARYESAAEEALVGGDLYDVYRGHAGVRVLIGDVRGKGLDGVAHAARVIRAFRQSAAEQRELVDVAAAMNRYLVPFFGEEDFVTALLVDVNTDDTLTVVSCGHPPALLVAGKEVMPIDAPSGLPLGLATSFAGVTLRWRRHDRLLLYTDGLVEARDAAGRFLPDDTIAACLRLPDAEATLNALLTALHMHAPRGRTDDLALMLIDNTGTGPEVTALGGELGQEPAGAAPG